MDFFDLIFNVGPAIQVMMKMEYIPKESDFLELTPEQYMQYFKSNADTGEKLFALLPPNHEVVYDDIGAHDIPIVTGKEKQSMLNASKVIDDYCESAKYPLPDDEAKLRFAAARLPDVFSKGTKFENAAPMNIE